MQFPDDQIMNGKLPFGIFHGFKLIQQRRNERVEGDMLVMLIMHGGRSSLPVNGGDGASQPDQACPPHAPCPVQAVFPIGHRFFPGGEAGTQETNSGLHCWNS